MFMLGNKNSELMRDLKGAVAATERSQGVIEFKLDGTVLRANQNFLALVSYTEPEVVGKHHSIFVDKEYAASPAYRDFWAKLNQGDFVAQKFKRISKSGKAVWIQASYNPVLDDKGKPYKVIKFATDITAIEAQIKDVEAKMVAISRSQGLIEFALDGTVLDANDNFLAVIGYRKDEIVGKNHSTLVDRDYARSSEYRMFWERLGRGEYVAEKFRRIAKSGADVWIQASYNPLFDESGKPYKVLKFATDVTEIENERRRAAEEERSGKAMQVRLVVSSLGKGLDALAHGDLTSSIDEAFADEYEKLRADFNETVAKLRRTLTSVMSNAEAVQSGTNELAVAADDLAKRIEQQAASVEETSAALNEVTATVSSAAQSTKKARDLVAQARTEAEYGGEIVSHAVDAMKGIENSSSEVARIISVIDEIAFQTNLLALNAGVEAARAGDAGRGFAVVASEVRALAQRSAEAAKEIKALIMKSSAEVGEGSKLVTQAGTALINIVSRVNEVNDLIVGIAAGTEQQSQSLAEVNSAIGNMDQDTQQNAATVEESTAATHSLAREASALAELVSAFNLGSGSDSPLRSELQKVAPHIFRNASTKPEPRRAAPRVPLRKAAGSRSDGWEEF